MSEHVSATSESGGVASWIPGIWHIDPTHSQITFTIRHALVPVRCSFLEFAGDITLGDSPEESEVHVKIKASSFSSGFEYRDGRVRQFDDLLNSGRFPTISYDSLWVTRKPHGDDQFRVGGELELLGVRRPIDLDVTFLGFGRMEEYGTRAGFVARSYLDRRDFGMTRDTGPVDSTRPLGDGSRILGWTVDVEINLEAVLSTDTGRYGLDRVQG